jgi:malate/lactate dehydrogenase
VNVAIVGAGPLGGTLAHLVARRDLARTVRLIDNAGEVAAGKALDIMQAAPIEGFACTVTGSSDITQIVDASIVVLADDARGAVWEGDAGVAQLNRLRRLAAGRPIVCSGAGHGPLVERGVRELAYERERLFGSAPEALVSALRALVAIEVDGSPGDVSLLVLGVPPMRALVSWEHATVGGLSAIRALDESVRRRLQARIPELWPPGPLALAAAAAHAVAALAGRSRCHLTAFVAPDDRLGRRARVAAWPVTLGTGGLTSVIIAPLNPHEQTALDNATLL